MPRMLRHQQQLELRRQQKMVEFLWLLLCSYEQQLMWYLYHVYQQIQRNGHPDQLHQILLEQLQLVEGQRQLLEEQLQIMEEQQHDQVQQQLSYKQQQNEQLQRQNRQLRFMLKVVTYEYKLLQWNQSYSHQLTLQRVSPQELMLLQTFRIPQQLIEEQLKLLEEQLELMEEQLQLIEEQHH